MEGGKNHKGPSTLYRVGLWRLGVRAVQIAPSWFNSAMSHGLTEIYWGIARQRCEVVTQNLLPIFGGDQEQARATAKRLLKNFGLKLIDLWRYEGGMRVHDVLGQHTGWEHYEAAKRNGKGVLLLSPHLGNWELGGPWMSERGVELHIVTLEEPSADFTRFREAARARWNVKTLVVGKDPFGLLEIIRRLDAGATVALLVDRPSGYKAVEAQLFGRPLMVSATAAELARASGCALLPVYVPRNGRQYSAHILPAVQYNRAALKQPQARLALTQQIIQTFEPVLWKFPDQWYNFVPVWQEGSAEAKLSPEENGGVHP